LWTSLLLGGHPLKPRRKLKSLFAFNGVARDVGA
jgi:hypothetical protein